jgi:hypothetical protein
MRNLLILICLIALFDGCRPDNTEPAPAPEAAILNFPAKDQPCTQGAPISAIESAVTFQWAAAANADSYVLNLKNLLNGTIATQTTATNQLTINLTVNTPYSWSVVSRSSLTDVIAKSETWKFYNSGPGVVSYAPFPADVVNPIIGEQVAAVNGKINLVWSGGDVDNDITSYDVYFGTTTAPALYKAGLTLNALNDLAVAPATTFYWKIITHDARGNTSDSGIFQFSIN